ncbi:LuxR C-terminal-related transcriptional regulator [Microbacterium koreense]|uniref:LuxR C-terminal-related transcriptional regulator n=1 Tax=Microbacterium koreense TaxID=323761 RepID=A0ABW2ZQT3_9MICO
MGIPTAATGPLSESERNLVARAVAQLPQRTRFPVAFGGILHDGAVHVSSIAGARTRMLNGLVVEPGRGLGGRALIENRPRLALDYRSSRTITHDYDGAVLGEGISTLFAIPIMVAGRSRGVLYCGSWSERPVGDVMASSAFEIASEMSAELRVHDEVERRLADGAERAGLSMSVPTAVREELRESYAELRAITASVADAELRSRLEALERRIASLSRSRPAPQSREGGDAPRLSPREVDVLAGVALGATNGEIAARLSLKEVTVKSYLQTAMGKLDASTRHAAVAAARKAGILP